MVPVLVLNVGITAVAIIQEQKFIIDYWHLPGDGKKDRLATGTKNLLPSLLRIRDVDILAKEACARAVGRSNRKIFVASWIKKAGQIAAAKPIVR